MPTSARNGIEREREAIGGGQSSRRAISVAVRLSVYFFVFSRPGNLADSLASCGNGENANIKINGKAGERPGRTSGAVRTISTRRTRDNARCIAYPGEGLPVR